MQGHHAASAKNHRAYLTRGPRPAAGRALAPSRSTVRPMATGASSLRCSSRRSSCSSRGRPRLYGGGKKGAAATATITQCRRSRCKSSPLTRGRRKSDPEHRWHDPGLNRWRRGRAGRGRLAVLRLDLSPLCMIKQYCMHYIYCGVLKLREASRGPWRSSPMNNSQY